MRQSIIRLAPLTLVAALIVGCATTQQSSRSETTSLTKADIEQGGSSLFTAREAVRTLRPQWLSPPAGRVASSNVLSGGGGAYGVVVYINDTRQPDIESLATVPAAKIVVMRYLDQNRAVQMHGPGHEGGVIEITTVDKRK